MRRGWFGKSINNKDNPDLQYGSLLWLINGRLTQKMKNDSVNFASNALAWLTELENLKGVDVKGEMTKQGISLLVNFIRNNENPLSLNYKLWQNTVEG